MSTQSIISLPPKMELTESRFLSLQHQRKQQPNKKNSRHVNFNPMTSVISYSDSQDSIVSNSGESKKSVISGSLDQLAPIQNHERMMNFHGRRPLVKISEQSFVVNDGEPLNLKISVEPRDILKEGHLRGYPPPSNAMLFDDDPGIMSEVETSSTGFRRGGKQRSSLPVVRTPSKTLERPLGLVFLQYRNETKRALLPNEITSLDTVRALFVRSFSKQLSMEYMDSPNVKIYMHDSSKDMFYELEDLRSYLREIRDRSVLRLFESADVSGGLPMAGIGIAGGGLAGHFEDPSYFSEPEFDSEYQHQHIHKSKRHLLVSDTGLDHVRLVGCKIFKHPRLPHSFDEVTTYVDSTPADVTSNDSTIICIVM